MSRKSGHIHLGADEPACRYHAGPEDQLTAEIGLVDCRECLALVQVTLEALVNGRATPQELARVKERAAELSIDERVALEEREKRARNARYGNEVSEEDYDEFRAEYRAKLEKYDSVVKRLGRALEYEEEMALEGEIGSGTEGYRQYLELLKGMQEPFPKGAAAELQSREQHEARLEAQRIARAALRAEVGEPFTVQMEPRNDGGWCATVGSTTGNGMTPHEAVAALFKKFEPKKRTT